MSHVTGTTTLQIGDIVTEQKDYLIARGTAMFAGEEVEVAAYGKTAEALSANQNGEIVAQIKIFGGSRNPNLKIERIISAAAPVVEANDERIEQVRKTLALKSKMTKPQIIKAVEEAISILES